MSKMLENKANKLLLEFFNKKCPVYDCGDCTLYDFCLKVYKHIKDNELIRYVNNKDKLMELNISEEESTIEDSEQQQQQQKEDYKIIKKYLLANETTYKNMKEMYPNISIPYIKLFQDEHLIYADGYLFAVSFDDKIGGYNYDSDEFYSIYSTHDDEGLRELEQNEIFIKMRECDVLYYALDFIEEQAFESIEVGSK